MSGWVARSRDDLHSDVQLPPDTVISLGRTPETGITDKSISKLHTLLKFQPSKGLVLCKQLGRNSAVVNGEFILVLIRNSRLELCIVYRIKFL